MHVSPLRAEHVLRLPNIEMVSKLQPITPDYALDLESCGGWTAFDGETPFAVGGIFHMGPGRGLAWMLMSREWRRFARGVTQAVSDHLDVCPLGRVEAAVHVDFTAGHRWMDRLGFALECDRMKRWGPDGDYALYARVR